MADEDTITARCVNCMRITKMRIDEFLSLISLAREEAMKNHKGLVIECARCTANRSQKAA